jgi:hypothetical protein
MYPPLPNNRPSSVRKPPLKPNSADAKEAKTPSIVSPKTPAVRITFDPATSRQKRKVTAGEVEPTAPYFGRHYPEQPKTTALAIFSFLTNDDLYHAGLVCKQWSKLAMDNELWRFQ